MAKIKQHTDVYVYQMKVKLEEISPPIWRRIQVTNNTTLSKLHRILQIIMGCQRQEVSSQIAEYATSSIWGNPTVICVGSNAVV
jgi:hypothetical protein